MVARSLHGRKADPRCTCPWRLFRSRCEIGSQRRAQRAKRTGFLMADASHNVADQARLAGTPNWRCCGRRMRPACASLPSMLGPCPLSQVLLKKTIFPAGSGTSNLECPSGTAHMSRFCPMGHQFVQFMVQTRFQVPGLIRFGPTLSESGARSVNPRQFLHIIRKFLERNSQKSESVRRWRSGSDFVISVYKKDYKIGATLKRGS